MSMDLYDPSAPTTTSDINLASAAAPSTNDAVTPDRSSSAVLSDDGGADSSATVVDHASLSVSDVEHVAAAPHDALLDQCSIVITESSARNTNVGDEGVSPLKSNVGCDYAPTLSQMLPQHSSSVVATEISASDAVPNSGGCVEAAAFSSVNHLSPLRQIDANRKGEDGSTVILQEANLLSSVMHPSETSETLTVDSRPKRSPSVSDEDVVPSGIRSRRKSSSSPARSHSRDSHSRGHRSRSSPSESKARSTDRDSAKHARSPESEARNIDRRDRRRDESRGRSPAGRDDRRRPNPDDRRHSETEYRKRGNFEEKRPYRRDDRSHNAQGYRRPANESGRRAEGPEGRRHNTGYDRKRDDREERADTERGARSGRREWKSPPSHFKQRPPSYGDFDRQGNVQHRQKRDGVTSKRDSRSHRSRSGSPARRHSRSPARRQSRSPARRQSRSPARRQSRSPARRQSRDYDAQRRGTSPDTNRSACSNGALQRKSPPPASAKAETVTSIRQSTAVRCEPSRNSPSIKPASDRVMIASGRSGAPLIVADHPSSAASSTEANGHANSSRRMWPDADGRMNGADENSEGSRDDLRRVEPSSERTVAEPATGLAALAESGSTREPANFAGDGATVLSSNAHAAASKRLQPSVSPVYRDVAASQTFEAPKNFPPVDVARSFSFSELMRLPPPPLPPPSLIMPLASCAPMSMTMGPMQPPMPSFASGIHGGVLPQHSTGLPPPLTSLGITLTPLGVPPPPLGVPPPPPLGLLPPTMPGMQLPMPFVPRPGFTPHISSASAQPPYALPQLSAGGRQSFVHTLAGPPPLPQASQPSPAGSLSSGVRGIDRLVGVHSGGGIVADRQQQHPDHASTVPASPPPPPELFLGKQNGDDAVKARSNLIVIRTEDAVENAGKRAENRQHSRNDRYSSSDDMTEAPMDMAADDDDVDDDEDAAVVAPPSKGLTNGKELSDKSSPQKNENQQAEPAGQAAGSNVVDVFDCSQADRTMDSNHSAEPPQPPQRTIEVLQQLQQLLSRGSAVPGQDTQAKADMHSGVLGAVLAGKASNNDEPAAEAPQKKMKKAVVGHTQTVKDASPGSDIPSSATELSNQRVIEKMNRQERIAEEIKVVLKPYYRAGKISKLEYKEIMKKAVHKIYNSKSGAINPSKVKAFVDGYVTKTIQMQKLLKKRQHVQT